jgi:protein-S-isoprenylcysteine O-methyltransferase Ste14
MIPQTMRKPVRIGIVIVLSLPGFLSTAKGAEKDVPFEEWYGNWPVVLTTSFFFLLFLFFLTRPRRPKEWKGAGLTAAFFISLFTEMFGIPLTIYLLAPLLGVEPEIFGMYESHLWAYFVSRTGLVDLQAGVHLVMFVSTTLLVLGFSLVALGWKRVYRGQGELVTTGLYAKLRHPQYLGLIIMVIAFLIMWPTLLTLLLAPFLIVKYFFLAKEEDRELEQKFGDEFARYRHKVPAFIPLPGSKTAMTLVALSLVLANGVSQGQTVEETLGSLGKGPTLGLKRASVSIVEFSDFQCSFCRKFWADALPKLKDTYIKQGKVQFVYRHFAILETFPSKPRWRLSARENKGNFGNIMTSSSLIREDWRLRSPNSNSMRGS